MNNNNRAIVINPFRIDSLNREVAASIGETLIFRLEKGVQQRPVYLYDRSSGQSLAEVDIDREFRLTIGEHKDLNLCCYLNNKINIRIKVS